MRDCHLQKCISERYRLASDRVPMTCLVLLAVGRSGRYTSAAEELGLNHTTIPRRIHATRRASQQRSGLDSRWWSASPRSIAPRRSGWVITDSSSVPASDDSYAFELCVFDDAAVVDAASRAAASVARPTRRSCAFDMPSPPTPWLSL